MESFLSSLIYSNYDYMKHLYLTTFTHVSQWDILFLKCLSIKHLMRYDLSISVPSICKVQHLKRKSQVLFLFVIFTWCMMLNLCGIVAEKLARIHFFLVHFFTISLAEFAVLEMIPFNNIFHLQIVSKFCMRDGFFKLILYYMPTRTLLNKVESLSQSLHNIIQLIVRNSKLNELSSIIITLDSHWKLEQFC